MSPNSTIFDIQPETLQRIARDRPAFWLALVLTGALLGGLGLGIVGMGWPLPPSGAALPLLKAGTILMPGWLWLGIFALLERDALQLHRINLLLWMATAAFYVAAAPPLFHRVFALDEWLLLTWRVDILADALIIAPLEMLLIYWVLRIGVFPSNATGRRMADGPAFGVAAGLGAAAAVNWLRIGPGDLLTPEEALMAATWAMGYAAMGAWLGFALARAQFFRPDRLHPAVIFFLTILLHTLFYTLARSTRADALEASARLAPYLISLFLASASFALLAWRMRVDRLTCLRLAARLRREQKRLQSRSLLAHVMPMAGTHAAEPVKTPLAVSTTSTAPAPVEDELTSLKRSWEALIAEQEGGS